MPKRSKSKKKFTLRRVTLRSPVKNPDWLLAGTIFCLTVFGLVMVANASVVEAARDFGDKLHFLKLQGRWVFIGMVAFAVMAKIDYHRLKAAALPLLLFCLASLILVLIPGISQEIMGARRWLGFGILRYQPGELTKLSLIVYLSTLLASRKTTWPFLVLLGVVIGLIMLEPDLGTTVIIGATALTIYFVSGAPLWLMGAIAGTGILGGAAMILGSAYRRARLMTFLNPERDPLGASYHIRQVLLALGSGGIFGIGLGQSRQKYQFLPEVTTDSIFAVIAEELGFIGGSLVVVAFLILVWRGIRIAVRAPDELGRLLAVGLTAWFGFQALVNLAAMVALVPLTGVPLPFISYGGSSLVLALTGAGILVNISKYRVVEK